MVAIALFFLGGGYLGLGASPKGQNPSPSKNQSQRIKLNSADVLTYDVYLRPDVQRLIGNVSFSHGNATMTCDSAYLNEKEQTFEAFGQVHMVQADTVNMYAQYLHYDGRTKLAKLRRNVKLENRTTTVFTDSLDYDRIADMAYYFDGGTIVDEQNTLTSDYGQFFPRSNDAEFRYNVKVVNDSTEITTQHLFYNTETRVGHYSGETYIKSDSGYITSQRGAYDLQQNVGILLQRSEVYSGNRMLVGDSIYYNGSTGFGEAFGAMELHDTLQRASLYGDYGYFDRLRDYGFATSRAYAIDYSQKDTLYIGADTLELLSFKRDILADTSLLHPAHIERDSMAREVRARSRVKVFRHDAQAMSDNLRYSSTDSVLWLLGKPMMWQEQRRQVSGDTIVFYFKNRKLDYNDILGQGFAIEQMADQANYFNQIKGERIRTLMQDTVVKRIEVFGDKVESIFYMRDEPTQTYSGMNRMMSGNMIVQLDSGRPKHTHWQGEVSGKLYPLAMATAQNVERLDGFNWSMDIRPKSPEDVITQDSVATGYSLSELKRFSGVQAALRIYEPYEREQQQLRQIADSLRADFERKAQAHTYTYILRSGIKQQAPYIERAKRIIDTPWQYNPFSAPGNPEPSNTSISTLTLPKRPKSEDSNDSVMNSSTAEN